MNALINLVAFAVGILAGVLFWCFVFMAFDWVFPGVLHAILPDVMAPYSAFSIGAMFAALVFVIRCTFGLNR